MTILMADLWSLPVADQPETTPEESYTITIERGATGLWYVTGSMHPGLIVVDHTMSEALSRVEGMWADLQQADKWLADAK